MARIHLDGLKSQVDRLKMRYETLLFLHWGNPPFTSLLVMHWLKVLNYSDLVWVLRHHRCFSPCQVLQTASVENW